MNLCNIGFTYNAETKYFEKGVFKINYEAFEHILMYNIKYGGGHYSLLMQSYKVGVDTTEYVLSGYLYDLTAF